MWSSFRRFVLTFVMIPKFALNRAQNALEWFSLTSPKTEWSKIRYAPSYLLNTNIWVCLFNFLSLFKVMFFAFNAFIWQDSIKVFRKSRVEWGAQIGTGPRAGIQIISYVKISFYCQSFLLEVSYSAIGVQVISLDVLQDSNPFWQKRQRFIWYSNTSLGVLSCARATSEQ